MPNRIGRALLAIGLCAMLAGCQNDQAASPVERPDAVTPASSASLAAPSPARELSSVPDVVDTGI